MGQIEIFVDNIHCHGLAMDNDGALYVALPAIGEVRKYDCGKLVSTIGSLNNNSVRQLEAPHYVTVGHDGSVYVSDWQKHQVIKYEAQAINYPVIVAGSQGNGQDLSHLSYPASVAVDTMDNVYVVEVGNHRITRWIFGESMGEIIIRGEQNQFSSPTGLSFDRDGYLYVTYPENRHIQQFSIVRH